MRNLYISRFRLFHQGYLEAVKYILEKDQKELIIGIGASQHSHSPDNPFTGKEREEMIRGTLRIEGLANRTWVVQIDETNIDYDSWTSLVQKICPPFDLVYSNSELVRLLFARDGYQVEEVPKFKRKEYSFDFIRDKILKHEPWEDLLPYPVARFMKDYQLDKRLIKLCHAGN